MKTQIKLLWVLCLAALLCISIFAKETVVYENDFSDSSLSDFTLNGNWTVSNGMLTLSSGGVGYIKYNLGSEYADKNFRVEVDFLGHTSTGGICIGAVGEGIANTPVNFFGYDGFIGAAGTKGAFGCYDSNGEWKGNIGVGKENIDVKDLHLCAEIIDGVITYTVTSLDGTTKYFGIEYTIGQSDYDVYNALSGIVGLRKFYSDKGSFDNFKVTLIEEDSMYTMSTYQAFCGVDYFRSVALRVSNDVLRGTGAMMSHLTLDRDFKVDFTLVPAGVSRFFFGMDAIGNGYAFEINKNKETASFYQLNTYSYTKLAEKPVPVTDGEYNVSVQVLDGIATMIFDAYSEGENAFNTFEMQLDGYMPGKIGFGLQGGNVKNVVFGEPVGYEGETYVNSLVRGADPDVLFYDNTYYLYNRINDGDNIFVVYTSADLAKWTYRGVVFTDSDEYTTSSYMSPNAFYYDGVFYLFYAAKNEAGESRIYYATSDSPYGPFVHKNGQSPIHDVLEIGGHPYLDESGKVYMTYVRFDSGNHIWMEEVTLSNGTVTPVGGTLTKVISPEFEYEIDSYGAVAEGGVIHKHNGYYYMIYASGHYLGEYGESYAVSKNILGPYTKYKYNEILVSNSQIRGVGDGIFVPSPDGNELYMVYHKHFSTTKVSERQTCIDKVKFVTDKNGGPDILRVNGPTTTPQPLPSNIYRYDIDRDGKHTLIDALKLAKHFASVEYNGRYDVDGDGSETALDILLVIKEVLN